jgi:signal transduction histidine kinase
VTRRRVRRKLERLERQRALDRERARIAQDLHDDLGAGLTEIGLTSELVQDPLVTPEESRSYAAEIATRARELVAALDEIVWAVNPRNDTVRATAAYFCQFAQHLLKPAGIRCRLEVDKDLPEATLSSDQRHHLFLAFKEACHNVVQHARATEVQLSIRADAGMIEVALADNGQGMASGVAPAGEGHDGLLNMQARMVHLGGTFAVKAEAPQGTRVTLRLPLHAGSRGEFAGN